MKKFLSLVVVVLLITSCNQDCIIQLKDGSTVKAFDTQDRGFKIGDKVCVKPNTSIDGVWTICNDGEMKDTLYLFFYTLSDSVEKAILIEHRIGIVKGF